MASNIQTLGAIGRKTISWLYIYTLYPPILAAAAAALLKGLFIWLDHRLTVRLCHLTGSGPDSLSHRGSAGRISCSSAQHNVEGENIQYILSVQRSEAGGRRPRIYSPLLRLTDHMSNSAAETEH